MKVSGGYLLLYFTTLCDWSRKFAPNFLPITTGTLTFSALQAVSLFSVLVPTGVFEQFPLF